MHFAGGSGSGLEDVGDVMHGLVRSVVSCTLESVLSVHRERGNGGDGGRLVSRPLRTGGWISIDRGGVLRRRDDSRGSLAFDLFRFVAVAYHVGSWSLCVRT